MRVLLLSWEHPPRVHGGLGRHVHALARGLTRRGHEVHVLTTAHPSAPAGSVAEGVHVHRVAAASTGPWPAPGWPDEPWLEEVRDVNALMSAAAAGLVDAHAFDLVHAHDWMVGSAAIALVDRSALPLVVTVHATERGRHQGWLPGRLSRWVDEQERRLAAAASQVIVCSRSMAAQVAAHLGVGDCTVIGNGVERTDAGPAGATRGRATVRVPPQVLFVGRLEHEKGVHLLLEAVAALGAEGRAVRLAIAGDGTQRRSLEEQAVALGVDAVTALHGFCDPAALTALHARSAVAVVPSLYEPFGLVALEAMAAGTPLVAARVGGLAELVEDGVDGLLVAPDDASGLAAAISRVLDDPVLAARLTERGLARAAAATWGEVADRTAEVYARTRT